jgi:hypothetical protein
MLSILKIIQLLNFKNACSYGNSHRCSEITLSPKTQLQAAQDTTNMFSVRSLATPIKLR